VVLSETAVVNNL